MVLLKIKNTHQVLRTLRCLNRPSGYFVPSVVPGPAYPPCLPRSCVPSPLSEGDPGTSYPPLSEDHPLSQVLRTLRCLKAIRVLRMLTIFEDLWNVVQLFYFSLRPLMWMCLFSWLMIFIFSMFVVVLLGRSEFSVKESADPLFMSQIAEFEYTVDCLLTMFRIMTLDNWLATIDRIFHVRSCCFCCIMKSNRPRKTSVVHNIHDRGFSRTISGRWFVADCSWSCAGVVSD